MLSGTRSGAGRAGDTVRRLEPRRQHLRPLHRQQRPRLLQPPPERRLIEHRPQAEEAVLWHKAGLQIAWSSLESEVHARQTYA